MQYLSQDLSGALWICREHVGRVCFMKEYLCTENYRKKSQWTSLAWKVTVEKSETVQMLDLWKCGPTSAHTIKEEGIILIFHHTGKKKLLKDPEC